MLSNNGEQLYSRAGMLNLDNENYLVNPSGYRLKGFDVNSLGAIDSSKLLDLQVSQADRPGAATTQCLSNH